MFAPSRGARDSVAHSAYYVQQSFRLKANVPLIIQSTGLRLLAKLGWRMTMPTLGEELTRLRKLRGWTLRDVEEKSKKKVSNSYLYQLENDNVKEPSPHILYELSIVYGAAYPGLMRLAGFVVPSSSPRASQASTSLAFDALNLSDEEREEVM